MHQFAEIARQHARAAHIDSPQYQGHWDGPEWRGVQVRRRVETKAGIAFMLGDITIARVGDDRELTDLGADTVIVYSPRNGIDTAVSARDVKWIPELTREEAREKLATTTPKAAVVEARTSDAELRRLYGPMHRIEDQELGGIMIVSHADGGEA